MPYNLFAPAIYLQTTPGAAYASSTTLTDVSSNPQYVMPPNTITTVGQSLHFVAGGVYSDTATPTLVLGFYKNTQTTGGATGVGGAAIGATTPMSIANGQTNCAWRAEVTCTFTGVGASGTVFSVGFAHCSVGTTQSVNTVYLLPVTTPQTALTFDTTKPTVLSVGAQWSASSASNTLVCNLFQIRLLS